MNASSMHKMYLDGKTGHGPFYRDESMPKPNILLISADMVPQEFLLKDRAMVPVHTPNLDALRKQGVFFRNAFSTSPLCSPSRAAYLTGRYSYITSNAERGHDGHAVHLRDRDILFPEYLKAAGYQTRHSGKCHVGARKFLKLFGENDSPWDRWSPPWYDDEQYIAFLKKQHLEPFSFERSIYGQGASPGQRGNFYGGWIAAQNGRSFPKQATYPAFLIERALPALNTDKPLYLQLDFFAPHQPFAIPGGMEQREEELRRKLKLPLSYTTLAENGFRPTGPEPRVYRLYRKNWGLREQQTVIDYRVANQLQFELVDELLGQLFTCLKDHGLYDSTWIVFLADHGEMNGELGLIDKGAYLNPRVLRAPLLIKPPADVAFPQRGREVDDVCSLLDLAPTILQICGIETPERLDGCSLFDTAAGAKRPEEKALIFEVWHHVIPNPCVGTIFAASDGQLYSYVYNATDDRDELYRLGGAGDGLNCIDDPAVDKIRVEGIRTLTARTEADPRWFVYNQYLRLEYAELLPAPTGDRQLFVGKEEQ
ncbi:MAG: sulfatase-like hydrolase/transferase [Spirochaetaceae bacterium]|nr:MAG: sulfatase-like hydrolase/transferase [Spirochaetaceae bacterium]